jgi:hypothetical protein
MNKTIVIYHRSDFDGIFCREIARKFLPDAELIGWEYGDPEPVVPPDTNLYILDLSVPGLMSHPKLIWIDHHKSAIEKCPTAIPGYRIDGVAACRLAWQWFKHVVPETGKANPFWQRPTKEMFVARQLEEPLAVRLAGEYDIWDHRGDGDLELQFGLDANQNLDLQELLTQDGMVAGDTIVGSLIDEGSSAMRCYSKRDGDIMRVRSFQVAFDGIQFLALNTARCNSDTFAALDVPTTGHAALLAFFWNGREWNVSLYHAAHRKDIDLSLIAVKYGGGGHRGACGFRAAKLPFLP